MRAALAVVVLAGCAIPAEKNDTRDQPLFCLGVDPGPADQEITVTGRVINAFSQKSLMNVPVEGHLVVSSGTDTPVFAINTGASGEFSQAQEIIGAARQVYLRATPDGFLETRYYPATAIGHSFDTSIQVITMENLQTIEAVAGITVDLTKANLLISAVDCNDQLMAGVTITTEPAGTILYFVNGDPSTAATMTDARTGTALIANAPPGPMTITATLATATGAVALIPNQITATAGVITQAEVQP